MLVKDGATTPQEDTVVERQLLKILFIYIDTSMLPFQIRFIKSKKENREQDNLKTHNMQVNIPLLDAMKQIPWYAKFIKDLCTTKCMMKGNEVINLR